MSTVSRRCGCRDDSGHTLGAKCPRLADPKHGTWGFAVSAGTNPATGRRLQVRKMGFDTKKAAEQARAKTIDQLATGRFRIDSRTTLATYLEGWLDRRETDGMRASTIRMYRRYVAADIVPVVGAVKLTDLRKRHVDDLIRGLTQAGRGAVTVRRIHATLSSALSDAQKLDLVDSNVAFKVALPQTGTRRLEIWEPDEVRRFLDATTAHRLGAVFELAALTGLRRGELAGLRWIDVDLARRELVVRQQRVQLGGSVVEGLVKTSAGQDRRVSLGDQAVGALIAWQVRQSSERDLWSTAYNETGYVFTREDGLPIRPAYLSRVFEEIAGHAGLPKATLHGLRHVHASLMLAAGVPLALVSKRLGHSTIAITSDLYSHLLTDANRAAADAAEGMLPPKSNQSAHTLHTREAGK